MQRCCHTFREPWKSVIGFGVQRFKKASLVSPVVLKHVSCREILGQRSQKASIIALWCCPAVIHHEVSQSHKVTSLWLMVLLGHARAVDALRSGPDRWRKWPVGGWSSLRRFLRKGRTLPPVLVQEAPDPRLKTHQHPREQTQSVSFSQKN